MARKLDTSIPSDQDTREQLHAVRRDMQAAEGSDLTLADALRKLIDFWRQHLPGRVA